MQRTVISLLHQNFEDAARHQDGVTYWLARDIQPLLEYSEWRNFHEVIEKAKIACANSGQAIANHFVEVNKMVQLGSGSKREIKDLMLTRYACYLIAQNGDPNKDATDVRAVLAKSDIRPENLPPEEDIKKLERRVKSQNSKLLRSEAGLKKLDS